MGTTPAGFGTSLFGNIPFYQVSAGVATQLANIMPPGGRVCAVVDSNGAADHDDPSYAAMKVPTLAAALPHARANKGDVILVAPGHTENVADATMLTNLKAGTIILGLVDPHKSYAPTFTFTATASQWAVSVADVQISGLRLVAGVAAIVKAINITGAGCRFEGNYVHLCDASYDMVIGVEVGAGAHDCHIVGNDFQGESTGESTSPVIVAAVVNRTVITRNNFYCSTAGAAKGQIQINAACLGLVIWDNTMWNGKALSTGNIEFAAAASEGVCGNNMMAQLNNGVATAQGILGNTTSLVRFFENRTNDEKNKNCFYTPAALGT